MQTYVKHLGYKSGGRKGSSSIKSHVKYMEQRKDEQGERERREIFNHENQIDRIDFYKSMDKLPIKGVLAHKLIISMDRTTRNTQDIDLKELTRRTIGQYEQEKNCKLNWVSCIHESKNPHSHIVILGQDSNNKRVYIMPKDLRQLKKIADRERKLMEERNIERLKLDPKGLKLDLNKQLDHERKLEKDLKPLTKEMSQDLKNIFKGKEKNIKRTRGR